MLANPFDLRAFELDVRPSAKQVAILAQIDAGDRLIMNRAGNGYTLERSGRAPAKYLIESLLRNQWVVRPCPMGPLFGDDHDGRLTSRGRHALLRAHTPDAKGKPDDDQADD